MKSLRAWLFRLRGWFRRRAQEAEMRAELEGHLEGLTERNLADGMSPAEARRAAVLVFGGVEQVAERARDQRRSVWLEQLGQDLRYAVRSLAKSPSFTITAVLTLALGIGVNTAMFTLFNTAATRSPAVREPESLVGIQGRTSRGRNVSRFGFTEYLRYREGSRALEGLIAFYEDDWTLQGAAGAASDPTFDRQGLGTIPVTLVPGDYFAILGGAMQVGRGFLAEEVPATGGSPVMVLRDEFWGSRYQRDPGVIGSTLRVGGYTVTVIGVAARGFTGHRPVPPAGWLPLSLGSHDGERFAAGGPAWLQMIGRLRPGVTAAQAKADLEAIALAQAAEFPGEQSTVSLRLERGLRFVRFDRSPQGLMALGLLFLGFWLVLAIACTNVATLLLARGMTRQAEIGVRLSLGAGRGRIVRQLLTENGLLCTVGAGLGLVVGTWTLQVVQPLVLAPYLPDVWVKFLQPELDLRVLGFTALLTLSATLVAGLLPAWHASGAGLIGVMRGTGGAGQVRVGASRLRRVFVISQVAICVMVLSGAGLLVRKFLMERPDLPRLDLEGVVMASLSPNPAIADRNEAFRQALATVRDLPGVAAVGMANTKTVVQPGPPARVRATTSMGGEAEDEVPAAFVSDGFFATFGLEIQRGRTFAELELQSTAQAVVVSASLARRWWPGAGALGRTVAVAESLWRGRDDRAADGDYRDCMVIGVVQDGAGSDPESDDPRQLYLPLPLARGGGAVFVKTRNDSAAALAEIVRAADAAGVVLQFEQRAVDLIALNQFPYRAMTGLSGSLGLLALGMATVGLFGLMLFTVSQRVHEIGVRMALGATTSQVVALIVRQGMRLVALGVVIGLGGGALLALGLEKVFFGMVQAFDPVTFGVVTLGFAVVALFACWLPARRAASVDPVVALRAE